ncbi:MAG TPA: ATP synthase subunit I [Gammaproteobacteria bacterium]
MLTDDSRVVPLMLLAQTGVTVGLALLLKLGQGDVVARSALIGGMTAVIPNGFLAARLLAPRAAANARALMRAAWLGEIGKLLLTALLFGAAFALIRPISPVAVLGGYIAAQLVVFGALLHGGANGNDNRKSSKNGR